jgi:hypothetical protein
MNRTGIVRTATVAGLPAALGLAVAAPAMAAPGPVTTVADLDGDGEIETVSAQLVGDGDQLISATVDGTYTSIHLPADSQFGIEAPRVADPGCRVIVHDRPCTAPPPSRGRWPARRTT